MPFFRIALALWLAIAPAYAGQMSLLGAGSAGAAAGGCSQATALIARMDGSQNTSAVTTAVCGMVTDGTWAKLDALYVFAINSAGNAGLNWVSTSFPLPSTPPTGCTFNANSNYQGDGTNCFFNTGYTPSTAGGNATLNSTTLGVCETLSFTGAPVGTMMAGQDASNASIVAPMTTTSTSGIFDVNDATFPTAAMTNMQGSWILTRNNNTQLNLYLNGALFTGSPMSATSTALVTKPIYIMAQDNNGATANPSFARIGYALIGGGMSATDVSNVRSRLGTYMTAVGASGC